MKSIFKLITALVMTAVLLSTAAVMAAGDRVEISFCVGDETLMINGTPVTVEKPYVVGEGVTLVPVRVITEAFGAVVDWDSSTKTVTLTYPDVVVVLQIDNPVAEVNGKAEKLLSAPELTDSGFTVVPLRFISETFGAEVSYDSETKQITVVKEISDASASTVEGTVNNKNIGDSYFDWSMENPKDMVMDYRNFDGSFTIFKNDDNNSFYIAIEKISDDYDFETHFNSIKSSVSDNQYTLVKADKNTDNPNMKTIHIQAKNKSEFINSRVIVTDKYTYYMYGQFESDKDYKDEAVRIMSTFSCDFSVEDVHDISTVKDGFREFKDENLKLSFKVPENFYMASSDDAENRFAFSSSDIEDPFSMMIVSVYSKDEENTAELISGYDYEHNKSLINEEIATFSDGVTTKQYDNFTAYVYEWHVKYEKKGEEFTRDVFFDIGDYVYNVAVTLKLPMDNYSEYADKIINSVKAEEIDSSEVGILMRNYPEATGTSKVKVGDISVEFPNNYSEQINGDTLMYAIPTGAYMSISELNGFTTISEVKVQMKQIENSQKKVTGTTVVSPTEEKKIGNNTYTTFTLKVENEDEISYLQQYVIVKNKRAYLFNVAYTEHTYSEFNRQTMLDVLASFKTN